MFFLRTAHIEVITVMQQLKETYKRDLYYRKYN